MSKGNGVSSYTHIHEQLNHYANQPVSYTHLRAHETDQYRVCRLLLEKIFF